MTRWHLCLKCLKACWLAWCNLPALRFPLSSGHLAVWLAPHRRAGSYWECGCGLVQAQKEGARHTLMLNMTRPVEVCTEWVHLDRAFFMYRVRAVGMLEMFIEFYRVPQ